LVDFRIKGDELAAIGVAGGLFTEEIQKWQKAVIARPSTTPAPSWRWLKFPCRTSAAVREQTAGAVAGVASLVMVPLVKFRGTDISIRSGPMGNRTFE